MTNDNEQLSFSIINTEMTVEAMRDSGYKSTTHALAELIDNSIEARAREVEIFGVSQWNQQTKRLSLIELAVMDDGDGMNFNTLRGSLRYGFGTRRSRKGIGRFGIGLPNSSMSQARRVDIWSWQSGVTNAIHTYLSIAEVEAGAREIPEPRLKPLPASYLEATRTPLGDSGTLVVWSQLDRVQWKRASTTFRHTEALLGRIYRRFLVDNPREVPVSKGQMQAAPPLRRVIRCIPVELRDNRVHVKDSHVLLVRPNDPLYLMAGTSCPEDFGHGPMFQEYEGSPFVVPIIYDGDRHEVVVRASHVRRHARDPHDDNARWPEEWRTRDSGHTTWGKHAAHNMGVSVVRANREVQLDQTWVSGDDSRERWWTVEVDIPTALDELFGVTNNKQNAVTFQQLAHFDWQRERYPDEEKKSDVLRRMRRDGDPRVGLLDLQSQIKKVIGVMRDRVKEAKKTRKTRHGEAEEQIAERRVTAKIKERIEGGHKGESDLSGEEGTTEEHKKAQLGSLVDKHHIEASEALRLIDQTIREGSRVRWIQTAQHSPAFFDVESLPNVVQVALNTKHPVYTHLYDVLHANVDDLSDDDVRDCLARASAAFRVLFYAWARYEDEQTHRARRPVRDARLEWGKYAEDFFDDDDDAITLLGFGVD